MSISVDALTRTCAKCKESLPESPEFFHRQKSGKGGLSPRCKACVNESKKAHRTKNPGVFRSHSAADRAKARGAFDEAVKFSVLVERDGTDCAYCGLPMDIREGGVAQHSMGAEFEHLRPLSRGGRHCYSNVALSCQECNRRKRSKTPYEFVAWAYENDYDLKPNAFVKSWLKEYSRARR